MLEALIHDYGPLVSSICRRMIRDEETARDAAQEVWLEATKSFPSFRGEAEEAKIETTKHTKYTKKENSQIMPNYQELTAPCGLDCFNCPLFEGIITEETRQAFAKRWNIPLEKVACKGCRAENGCHLHAGCATLDCVQAKGVLFCFECDEFPCSKLQPAVDGAAIYPHNTKLFHLCRMKAIGVERWAVEEALTIRNKYYKGKFVVGAGPVME